MKRLIKRSRRHENDLFTFLDQANFPFDNIQAERSTYPAVIVSKNIYGNLCHRGDDCQTVVISIFRTSQ